MTRLQAGALWVAALAVFLALNPIAGMDQRVWQEKIFLFAGLAAALVSLSGALPLALFGLWLMISAAQHGGGAGPILMVLSALGVYALARRGNAANVIRAIVAVNVVVMLWQATGAWQWVLRLAFPRATYAAWNPARPWAGLTMGTGDVACVLAMGLPFLLVGRWRTVAALAAVALLTTQALSGIVAGCAGLLVAAWPQLRAWWVRQGSWRVAYAGLGLMATSVACEAGEIGYAIHDERWRVWGEALRRWFLEAPITGHGVGSWAAKNFVILDPATSQARLWTDLHFDLLQLGYETGIIGVALALAAFAWLWRRGSWPARGGLAALAVCQFGHFPLHLAVGGVMAALVAGEAARG